MPSPIIKVMLRAWSAITFKDTSVSLSLPYSTPATLQAYSIMGNIKSVSKLEGLPWITEAKRSKPAPVSIFLLFNGG